MAAQGADLTGLSGPGLRASELEKGDYVLVVWASWSPRCRDIVERVNALERRWSGRARIVAVSFNEEKAQVETFLAGKGLSVPAFIDAGGAFSRKHAITVLPGLVVLRGGKVLYSGKLPDSPDALLEKHLG